jgi:amino acid transporter
MKTATLMAPGALIWVMFSVQAANAGGVGDMGAGIAFALVLAAITAFCFSRLAKLYPSAGGRGSYFFAEKAFLDQERSRRPGAVRAAKIAIGWAAHLYYWMYPGILIAFLTFLIISTLGEFGIEVLLPGKILLAGMVALLAAMLAGRGISGSSTSAVVANLMQMMALGGTAVAALVFRWQDPLGIRLWSYSSPAQVFLPASLGGTVFQAALAILILAGFEASTSLAVEALRPKSDIPRGTILSLLLQSLLIYLPGYAAFNLAWHGGLSLPGSAAETAGSGTGLNALATQIGDSLLGGNGFALSLVLALTCGIVLFGLLLASMNMGVRISFLMAQDREMPGVLGILHDDFATPYVAVWILAIVSGLASVIALLDMQMLTGFILAAGTGIFLLYASICAMSLAAARSRTGGRRFVHRLLSFVGLALNAGMIPAWIIAGLSIPGASRVSVLAAWAVIMLWGLSGVLMLFFVRRRRITPNNQPIYRNRDVHARHQHIYQRRARGESFASIARTLYISEQRVREIYRKYESWLRSRETATVDESKDQDPRPARQPKGSDPEPPTNNA